MSAQERGEIIPFERAGIGHNEAAAIADFIQKRRAIWAARVPSAVKVIALAILEHMAPDNMECWPSKDRLAYMCNMPRATFDRHYNAAKDLFHYHERRGKTTVFSPKILDVAKELTTLWPSATDVTPARYRYQPPLKLGEGQNAPPPKMTPPQNHQTPPQIGGATPPQIGGTKRQGIDQLEEKRDDARKSADKWDPFGLNPMRSDVHRDCYFDEGGRLQVANGFRSELIKIVGGEQKLRQELNRALRFVPPNTAPQYLKSKVLGQIQEQAARRAEQDERYNAAIENRKSAGPPQSEFAQQQDRIRANLEAARAKRNGQRSE